MSDCEIHVQNISQNTSQNNSSSSSQSHSKFKFSNTAQTLDITKRKTKHVEMFLDKEQLRDVSRNLDNMITGVGINSADDKNDKKNANNKDANKNTNNANNGFHIIQSYDKTYDNKPYENNTYDDICKIYSPICENVICKTDFYKPQFCKTDFCKTDLYGNDIFKNDFYKPEFYKPEFYKPEFYKPEFYKGDICKGDFYKGDIYKANFFENPFTNDIQRQQEQYQQQEQHTTNIEPFATAFDTPFAIPPGLDQQFMLPTTPFDASNSSTALQEMHNTANTNANTNTDTSIKLWKPATKTIEWENINKFVKKAVGCLNMMKNLNGMYDDRQNYTKQDVFDFWRYALYQAVFKYETPQRSPILHTSYIRDENLNTIAMILAKNMQQIPDYWRHSPTLVNADQETVAIIQAKRGIIPSEKWYHKNTMADKNKHTVLMSLVIKWIQTNKINYDSLYTVNQDLFQTMDQNPAQLFQTIYTINQDKLNKMFSERQANFEKWFSQIPQHWFHNATMFDYFRNTVALILAQNGIIPPKSICHRPDLKNCYKQRVVDYLFWYRLKIPAEWMVIKIESQIPMKMESQMPVKIESQAPIKIICAKNQKQNYLSPNIMNTTKMNTTKKNIKKSQTNKSEEKII